MPPLRLQAASHHVSKSLLGTGLLSAVFFCAECASGVGELRCGFGRCPAAVGGQVGGFAHGGAWQAWIRRPVSYIRRPAGWVTGYCSRAAATEREDAMIDWLWSSRKLKTLKLRKANFAIHKSPLPRSAPQPIPRIRHHLPINKNTPLHQNGRREANHHRGQWRRLPEQGRQGRHGVHRLAPRPLERGDQGRRVLRHPTRTIDSFANCIVGSTRPSAVATST
jgi:hypothetical protein